jgi:hypothetical protein
MITALAGPLLALCLSATPTSAGDCRACEAFDRFDKQVRDGILPESTARQQFTSLLRDLDAYIEQSPMAFCRRDQWVFPLRGYTFADAQADAAGGYRATGYDYFAGNRHGGHPSYDLFIRDRNRDSLDDRTGQPVAVVSMTSGIVVATETGWDPHSLLRGGKYLWVYDSRNRLLIYYAHNSDILAGVGDPVVPGTLIASVGRSGLNAAKQRSPTHLHLTVLQIHDDGPVPVNILAQLATLRTLPR